MISDGPLVARRGRHVAAAAGDQALGAAAHAAVGRRGALAAPPRRRQLRAGLRRLDGRLLGAAGGVGRASSGCSTSSTRARTICRKQDEPVAISLSNQLSVALRNLQLLGEARYYRDYLRQMIDVANALIIVIDRDANVAVMNRTMQHYLGFGPEVIGMPLDEIRRLSTAPEPRLSTLLLDGLRGVEYSDCEVPLARRNGRHRLGPCSTPRSCAARRQHRRRHRHRPGRRAHALARAAGDPGREAGHARSARRRRGARAQQPADLDQRLRRLSGAAARARRRQGDVDKGIKIVEGAARIQKLTRDLMSYARPSGEFELVAVNEVVRQALVFCEHVVAPRRGRGDAGAGRRAAPGPRHPRPAAPGAHQPHHQRLPRAAARGRGGDARDRHGRRRARRGRCGWPIGRRASDRWTATTSSSHSSPPRRTARAPAWACRSSRTS